MRRPLWTALMLVGRWVPSTVGAGRLIDGSGAVAAKNAVILGAG